MSFNEETLSDQVVNALSELGNIGAGNAATSLASMTSSRLTVSPPTVELLSFDSLAEKLGGAETNVVGILSAFEGDLSAMILFVTDLENAASIVEAVAGKELDWRTEIGLSAIKEVGNILIGSYVASLQALLNKKLRYVQPEICIDMAGAILDIPCIEIGKVSDHTLLINSKFNNGEKELEGYLMVFSDAHSYDRLLSDLGVSLDA